MEFKKFFDFGAIFEWSERGKILSHPNFCLLSPGFSPLPLFQGSSSGKMTATPFAPPTDPGNQKVKLLKVGQFGVMRPNHKFYVIICIGQDVMELPSCHSVLHSQVPLTKPPPLTPRGCSSNSCFEVLKRIQNVRRCYIPPWEDKNGTQEHNRLVYCEGCLELVFPEGAAVGPQKISSLGRPRVPVLFSQRRKCQRALEAPSPPEDLACAIPLPAVGTCRTQEHYINALGGDLDTEDSCFKKIQSSFKGCNLYAFLTH